LQAAAAERIALPGMRSIREAAKNGDVKLVRDHVLANPSSLHTPDAAYVHHTGNIPHYLYGIIHTHTIGSDANARAAAFILNVVIFVFFSVTEICLA
jgi:hypothetical protein